MKFNLKKMGIVALILTLFMSFTGCSFGNKSSQTDNSKETSQSAKNSKESKITVDSGKTTELKKEKSLINGKVYVQNNKVIATMVVKSGISDVDVKELANKYAKDLKKKYKSMPVTVMAVRDNKNVINVKLK